MNKNRFLCWDAKNIEKNDGVQIISHKPQKKNIALKCDSEWEGVHNGYGSIVKVGDTYRLYYRADSTRQREDKTMTPGKAVICVAESRDGITFKKPNVNKFYYDGTKNNNIVFSREKPIDNFSVFYDTNPACPADEKFKALSEVNDNGVTRLLYYASEDGYDFREMYFFDIESTFDSFNVMIWDEDREQYFLFYRGFHTPEAKDMLQWCYGIDIVNDIRDVRVATSKDFKNWTLHGRIKFEEGQTDYPLYTNQINKYYRSTDMFVGFPVRYCDRAKDKENFKFMPLGDRHEKWTEIWGREGTALTDCTIMTSNDGFTFDRRDEAFMTPGIEDRNNWWYGDCYIAYGFIETEAEEEGAPNEISMYIGENYRIKNVDFRRFTLRLDGFFSWFAPLKGGEVLTKPLTVTGDGMKINFATSVVGGVQITLCDENGNELDGYKSYTMFGDTTDRPVEFERSLSELRGKSVRLKIKLSDANLYSFIFE